MSTLTNEQLSKLWDDAMHTEDETVLTLITEIESLKRTIGTLSKRRAFLKRDYTLKNEQTRKKSFHRGQSYMRDKIAITLKKSGHLDSVKVALGTHIDYDIEPIGKYEEP